MKPLAIELYERFLNGETIEQIAADTQIPEERVAQRIRAAEEYVKVAFGIPSPVR